MKIKGAKSVNSFLYDNELAGLLLVSGTGFKTTNLGDLEKLVNDEIDKIKSDLVTDSELEKVKTPLKQILQNRLQTTMGKLICLRNTGHIIKIQILLIRG